MGHGKMTGKRVGRVLFEDGGFSTKRYGRLQAGIQIILCLLLVVARDSLPHAYKSKLSSFGRVPDIGMSVSMPDRASEVRTNFQRI
ncbi:hypothetical protein IG631_12391 [Alternaria alternata]|nr:hypothetical protein IG631_12391 [Alternaria alternata]